MEVDFKNCINLIKIYCFDSLPAAHSSCTALLSFVVNHVKLSFEINKKKKPPDLFKVVQFIKLTSVP